MIVISHDAVVDAIAKHFPDGIDCSEHGCGPSAEWHTTVAHDLGIYDADGEHFDGLDAVFSSLVNGKRLREVGDDGIFVLSWEEQARRVMDIVDPMHEWHPDQRKSRISTIASVLAGKINPKDV